MVFGLLLLCLQSTVKRFISNLKILAIISSQNEQYTLKGNHDFAVFLCNSGVTIVTLLAFLGSYFHGNY